jgi:hypothetical protein
MKKDYLKFQAQKLQVKKLNNAMEHTQIEKQHAKIQEKQKNEITYQQVTVLLFTFHERENKENAKS